MTTKAQRDLILGILNDIADDASSVVDYLNHVGFDIAAINSSADLPEAWLGHYRLGQGSYDVDRATSDLLTWPPISRRVFELQQNAKG
jgi:hypothetical protein